jgi:molybdate transport system substrate-binding protein
MRIASFATTAAIGFMLLAQGMAADAAEIKVLSVPPMKATLDELGPQFERTTGHKLAIKYDISTVLKRQIDAGETFDVAILLPVMIDDLVKQGKVGGGTRADIAKAGIGVAVKKGGPKPDIKSVDAFKQTLLNAKSVAYSGEGASGVYFAGLLERLGIAAETKPKLRPGGAGGVVPPVARGEAEIAIISIPTIVAEPGVDLVGPLPAELQTYIVYSGGVSAATKDAEAAKSFIKFLMTPVTQSVIKTKGLEPLTP